MLEVADDPVRLSSQIREPASKSLLECASIGRIVGEEEWVAPLHRLGVAPTPLRFPTHPARRDSHMGGRKRVSLRMQSRCAVGVQGSQVAQCKGPLSRLHRYPRFAHYIRRTFDGYGQGCRSLGSIHTACWHASQGFRGKNCQRLGLQRDVTCWEDTDDGVARNHVCSERTTCKPETGSKAERLGQSR